MCTYDLLRPAWFRLLPGVPPGLVAIFWAGYNWYVTNGILPTKHHTLDERLNETVPSGKHTKSY